LAGFWGLLERRRARNSRRLSATRLRVDEKQRSLGDADGDGEPAHGVAVDLDGRTGGVADSGGGDGGDLHLAQSMQEAAGERQQAGERRASAGLLQKRELEARQREAGGGRKNERPCVVACLR